MSNVQGRIKEEENRRISNIDCRNDGLWSLFVIPAVFKPESRFQIMNAWSKLMLAMEKSFLCVPAPLREK